MSHLTLERLKAWLADDANVSYKREYDDDHPLLYNHMRYYCIRNQFVTRNGYSISIQQSGAHYCSEDEVEMWCCPHSPLLAPYGDGEDPYANVPLEVVAGYIDSLESLPPPEET